MYTKETPFLAAIKERYRLTGPGSQKETWHLVLDLEGSGIEYGVGDCVGVVPSNAPDIVQRTATALGYSDHPMLASFLSRKSITELNARFVRMMAACHPNDAKRRELEAVLQNRDQLKDYLEQRDLSDFALEHQEVQLSESQLGELLQPLLPRFYSIASAKGVVGNEVHLLVRHVAYTSRELVREGVCTHFLCYRARVGEPEVPIFIQKTNAFCLPSDPTVPIIMVGPGTGVAPYRAFLQSRRFQNHQGKNWLFFGEWNREHDFFYRDFWEELEREGRLQLHTAFSRDQPQKVYVQHRMLEQAEQLWEWLQNGAYFYVCGDAKRMARDVDMALHQIVSEQGGMEATAARQFVRELRRSRRYVADVY